MFVTLAAFAMTHLLAVISPGPSLVVVLRATLGGSRRTGVLVALGMGFGTLIWAMGAWFGLAALFSVAPVLLTVLTWAGALYLIYLAVMMWRHAAAPMALAGEGGTSAPVGDLAAARLGLLTQLANPKVAVFFGSIFLLILPPAPDAGLLGIVFAIVFINEFIWYTCVALLIGGQRARAGFVRVKPAVDRVCGTVLGALGVRLIVD
ncbi:MAG: LysE family transporter [Pseudomonadota bacterium]